MPCTLVAPRKRKHRVKQPWYTGRIERRLIWYESRGKDRIWNRNTDGTYDRGRYQINDRGLAAYNRWTGQNLTKWACYKPHIARRIYLLIMERNYETISKQYGRKAIAKVLTVNAYNRGVRGTLYHKRINRPYTKYITGFELNYCRENKIFYLDP